MGLQSALTTSLTGLQAAETVIDVVGNNVANSSTVGFKESNVLFATQFLQTQSIGSAPTDATGGTNPRQIGLGVKVAAINPNFTQGTIQISSNPLDVAIQGDGFLLVEGAQGERLYTRNGQLQTNSQNQVVTSTGNRILGLTVDEDFNIIEDITNPVAITIPLGVPVAQETTAAFFSGNLSPNADVGTAGVLTSESFGDASFEIPSDTFDNTNFDASDPPDVIGTATNQTVGGSTVATGDYLYKVVWYTDSAGGALSESPAGTALAVSVVGAENQVTLDNLPTNPPNSVWDGRRIYRSADAGATYFQVGADIADVTSTGPFVDDGNSVGGAFVESSLDQEEYSYYVTYRRPDGTESRPTGLMGPFSIDDSNRRIVISDLPQPTGPDGFTQIAIYRNLGSAPTEFYRVGLVNVDAANATFIDALSDDDVIALDPPQLDLLGAKASATTPLINVVVRDGDIYTQPFVQGTLSFTGSKGGRDLGAKTLTIDADTNVGDLRLFMQQAFGIDTVNGGGSSLNGDGQLVFTSNAGVANELEADPGAFVITPAAPDSATTPIALDFEQTTDATGKGTATSFIVFDSLGQPVDVLLTTVRVDSEPGVAGATYRWFATSEDNNPTGAGVNTFLASDTLVFDLQGNITDPADGLATISVNPPGGSQLTFDLDFNTVSGLSVTNSQGEAVSTMSLTRQDGFPTGTLTSFTITESGLIRGVFSNGAERALGQILMAKFANTTGLQQSGNNLYAQGINSGEPIVDIPGGQGIGTLTAGAVELSNSDIGQNLIKLILASTQYRGGARVITTTQQLLDELLNLRR